MHGWGPVPNADRWGWAEQIQLEAHGENPLAIDVARGSAAGVGLTPSPDTRYAVAGMFNNIRDNAHVRCCEACTVLAV